jgi:hypothetical protein
VRRKENKSYRQTLALEKKHNLPSNGSRLTAEWPKQGRALWTKKKKKNLVHEVGRLT